MGELIETAPLRGYDERVTDISRRTALTAGAWSLPVMALAVATPLAAASGTGTLSHAQAITYETYVEFMAFLDPQANITLQPSYFSVEPASAVLDVLVSTEGPEYVHGILQMESPVLSGSELTINLPGYAPIVVPIE